MPQPNPLPASNLRQDHKHHDRFIETVTVSDFGAVGNDATADVAGFQAAIDAGKKRILVPYTSAGVYQVRLVDLTYQAGQPVRWDFDDGAETLDFKGPQAHVFAALSGVSEENVTCDIDDGDQISVYRCTGTNNSTGTGRIHAYDFNLTAAESTTGSAVVRGLIGRLINYGAGTLKAIRVGVTDLNTDGGARALHCANFDVNNSSATQSSRILELQDLSAEDVDDKTTAIHIEATNGARINNVINVQQGTEVNDAVLQASMGSGAGTNARFLKLKDDPATENLFEVTKTGLLRTSATLHAGPSTTNGVSIGQAAIERTASEGSLSIKAGTDAGSTLILDGGGSSNQFVMSDDGINLGGAEAGARKGVGTINAIGVYESGTIYSTVPDYVLEAAAEGEFSLEDHPGPQALRFHDRMGDELHLPTYSLYWKTNHHLPAMPSREEWERNRWSTGELVKGLWEELEKAHVFIDQLNQRVIELESD